MTRSGGIHRNVPDRLRPPRAAVWNAVLGILLVFLIGNDSVPAEEKNESAAAAKHDSVGVHAEGSAPAGQIDLIVSHRMERGRLLLRLAGSAFLSVPFVASGQGTRARFERPLSVPAGRHPVEITILDRKGRLVVRERTIGTVIADRSVILQVDEHSGSGDGLTLTWRTP